MTPTSDCIHRPQAAAYVLGVLGDREDAAFRAHVGACESCTAAVREAERTTLAMDLALVRESRVDPGEELGARLMSRVVAREAKDEGGRDDEPYRTWQHWTGQEADAGEDVSIVRGMDQAFETTGFDGIEVRPLSVDPHQQTVTMLVRMAPGSSYPRHRHATREECYVVAGDLRVGDERMTAGDYQSAPAGSVHEVQSTEGGCTLLIVSSQRDELLD